MAGTGGMPAGMSALDADYADMFLEGVRLHLAGCIPGEQLAAVRAAREGGATRYADLTPSISHIVVCLGVLEV